MRDFDRCANPDCGHSRATHSTYSGVCAHLACGCLQFREPRR